MDLKKWKKSVLMLSLFLLFFVSACGTSTNETEKDKDQGTATADQNNKDRDSQYEDDKMIGTAGKFLENEEFLSVDITEWENRNAEGPIIDMAYGYNAIITKDTVIRDEGGMAVLPETIKDGQKVLINPPRKDNFEGPADEIIVLEMTYEEKFDRFINGNGLQVSVIYDDGNQIPLEMQEPLFEKASNIMSKTEKSVLASWIEYDKDYVVDYKKEFEVKEFPIILLFDEEKLLFKTYHPKELYDFLENLEK